MNALQALLAAAAASYVKPEPIMVQAKAPKKRGRPAKVQAAELAEQQDDRIEPNKRNPAPAPTVSDLPIPKSYDAEAFIKKVRMIGIRKGKLDKDAVSGDQIRLLIGYLGSYQPGEPLARQVDNARRAAMIELKTVKYGEVQPRAMVTVAGFVAGMPNNLGKRLGDLEGRLQAAITELGRINAALYESNLSPDARANLVALLTLETDRKNNLQLQVAEIVDFSAVELFDCFSERISVKPILSRKHAKTKRRV